MSRLYVKTKTDYKSGNGRCGVEFARASIYWGSAVDSKLAAHIEVSWPKGSDKPVVKVLKGYNIGGSDE